MTTAKGALVRPFAVLFVSATLAACGSDRAEELGDVNIAPPGAVPVQTNVNSTNPTLTVALNEEVDPGESLTLVFSDEFDGTSFDTSKWFFETGDGTEAGIPGWGNNELQYYLPDSAQLEGGMLKITAREEQLVAPAGQNTGIFNYTSARINTRDRFAFRYGRIEARMKLPAGQGLWPAFWLLSQDSPYGTWAASGEIDVMEAVNLGGVGGNNVFGTIHYGAEFPGNQFTSVDYTVPSSVTDEFHVYATEWDANEMRWYVDDVLYAVQNNWFSTNGPFPAPFDHQFYIIFNLAVGGNLPGSPNATTAFPATMEVDWVRVYSGEP
ncbi:MAG: glycoside hydrolase family 16 protein [Pseudomonadota bacterium]